MAAYTQNYRPQLIADWLKANEFIHYSAGEWSLSNVPGA